MNASSPVVDQPRAGRQEIPVFPDWALAHATIAALPSKEAFTLYDTVNGAHDYWWPLLRDAHAAADVIIFDDTCGITAARLAVTCRAVIAVFDNVEAAAMLSSTLHGHDNLKIVVNAVPWDFIKSAALDADAVIWQRPSRHLAPLSKKNRYAVAQVVRSAVRARGAMLVDDNIREPSWATRLHGDAPVAKSRDQFDLRELRQIAGGGRVFIGARPLLRSNWPAAEITRRRSMTILGAALEGFLLRGLNLRKLRRYLVPRKAVVANIRPDSMLARVLRHPALTREVGSSRPEVQKIFAGSGDVTIALVGRRVGRVARAALRFGYRDEAVARLQRSRAALERLADGELAGIAPKLLCGETVESGAAYTAESFLSGMAISDMPRGSAKDAALEQAALTLSDFQIANVTRKTIDPRDFDNLLGRAFARIRDLVVPDRREPLDAVEASMRAILVGSTWPLHLCHGDFKAGNVLVSRDGKISGIIDWDMWEERGLPLLDLFALYAYDWCLEIEITFGPGLVPALLAGSWHPSYERMVARQSRLLGLDEKQVKLLRGAFWLRHVGDRLSPMLLINREAARTWVQDPLRQIEKLLAP